ncbi:UNVERIFIED_CONTAM: hypothetical protein GTU68_040208, partial [Idotea baltica]|nr:hypothetical protein [Idotea baltica]
GENTFYWFDYETFGISPQWDKPAQFAGQRTTLNLEPIGDPIILYCKPPADYLPNPHACRVTQMQPHDIAQRGSNEAEFIAHVVSELGRPGTCSIGYNSIRFDDEFTRHTLFRNFHDAYEYEWKDGNSRWDLLDVVRLARALRPEGINWPTLDDGTPTNKLELLSVANNIEHAHAHDALSDVEATIGMAKLLKTTQPKLFDYAFSNRDKKSVASILNYQQRKPCIQVSGMIPGAFGHIGIVMPIARHPVNQNGVIVLDLRTDPEELLALSAEQIAARVFVPADELKGQERIHLRTIQINKCPILVPVAVMRPEDAERLNFDLIAQMGRAKLLSDNFTDEFAEKIRQAMTREWDDTNKDIDGSLYSGAFFNHADKQRFAKIRQATPSKLSEMAGLFDDERATDMLFRYRARNFPDSLNAEERDEWLQHIKERLHDDHAPWLSASKFEQIMQEIEWLPNETPLRDSLERYAREILT